jgi:hypothetical protein
VEVRFLDLVVEVVEEVYFAKLVAEFAEVRALFYTEVGRHFGAGVGLHEGEDFERSHATTLLSLRVHDALANQSSNRIKQPADAFTPRCGTERGLLRKRGRGAGARRLVAKDELALDQEPGQLLELPLSFREGLFHLVLELLGW